MSIAKTLIVSITIQIMFIFPCFAEGNHKTLNNFLTEYTNQVFNTLTKIHNHKMTEKDRFIVIFSKGKNNEYVQCIFQDNDKKILCEAASGFYQKPKHKLSKKSLSAIAALGFSMDASKGNFQREIEVNNQQTLWAVAGLMLETLYRGYNIKNKIYGISPLYPIPQKKPLKVLNISCL